MPPPSPSRLPLVPSDIDVRRAIPRAAWAATSAALSNSNAADRCRELYPADRTAAAFLERSVTTGATTTGIGWAVDLTHRAVSAWLSSLAPQSAAATLIQRGLLLPIPPGAASLSVPGRTAPPTAAPWVGEAMPVPARAYALGAVLLTPHKIGAVAVLTRELAVTAAGESVVEALLREDCAVGLDLAYLGSDPGTTPGHNKGLCAGLTPLTGSAVMSDDLARLAETCMANGSGAEPVFIAAPGRAAAAAARVRASAGAGAIPILPSLALAADQVVAVDAGALVSAFSGDVEVDASTEALVAMDDQGLNIGTPGSPPVVAPAVSTFQANCIAVRALTWIAFGQRRAGATATMSGCTW